MIGGVASARALLPALALGLGACRDPRDRAADALETDPATAARLLAGEDDAWSLATAARAARALGDLPGAVALGEAALRADPTLFEAAWNLACHRALLGDRDGALAALAQAATLRAFPAEEAVADPDLAALRDDPRFVLFERTGALDPRATDVAAVAVPAAVAPGELVQIHLLALRVGLPFMAERPAATLHLDRPLPAGRLAPVERAQAFERTPGKDSETHHLAFRFTLRALTPGPLAVGPFTLRWGDRTLRVGAVALAVRGGPAAPVHASDPALEAFFRAPEGDDDAPQTFRAAADGSLPALDPPAGWRSWWLLPSGEGLSAWQDHAAR